MLKRYTCRVGDKTTVGGIIREEGERNFSIHGARVALEGDPIDCPACQTTGCVVCVEPRHKFSVMGRQAALGNDECRCACKTPPRLIASQTLHCQVFDTERTEAKVAREASSPNTSRMSPSAGNETRQRHDLASKQAAPGQASGTQERYPHSRWIRLTDTSTGKPLADTRCIVTLSGKTGEVTSDNEGYIVVRTVNPVDAEVHVIFAAPRGPLTPEGT